MINKKASIQDIAYMMMFIFVAAILFLSVKYVYSDFVDRAVNTTAINQSQGAVDALQTTKDLTARYDYIVFALLMGFTLAIIITGWLVGGHPLFAFIYFIALVLITAISAIFSFVWERVSTTPIFVDTVATLPLIDLILTNFPTYIAIIGFIGMLVMFAKPHFVQQ